jgi:hypothetical protein
VNWISVQQLVDDLQLNGACTDIEGLRKTIAGEMASIHPDRNGGDFQSPEVKERFHQLQQAEEWLQQQADSANALVPISQLPAIIAALAPALTQSPRAEAAQLRTDCRDDERRALRNRYALPKIGSGVFATISGALFTFSGSLAEHPVLGRFATDPMFPMFLGAFSLYAGMFFVTTWWAERREEDRFEWLMSEGGRRETFNQFLRGRPESNRTISVGELTEFLQETHGRPRMLNPFLPFFR